MIYEVPFIIYLLDHRGNEVSYIYYVFENINIRLDMANTLMDSMENDDGQ